jgi:hypothetical protein
VEAVEDVGAGGRQHVFGAEQILDRERQAVERSRLALRAPGVRSLGHGERPLRGLGDEGVQGPRRLDGGDVGLGQLPRRNRAGRQPVAGFCERQPR